jgi:mRNA-degrading endonuclease RelE of RelBE toxin-antitoxin system
MRVELASQVVDFVRSLAPAPRKKLRSALHDLEHDKGDIKPLTNELQGFYRLRVGAYRVIFRKVVINGTPVIRCDFAENRSVIYQRFKPT